MYARPQQWHSGVRIYTYYAWQGGLNTLRNYSAEYLQFDNFKNDLANAKAWGKSPVAIEQQALMGLMTYVLTQLFLQRRYQELALPKGDATQALKHARKVEQYLEHRTENDLQEHHADA